MSFRVYVANRHHNRGIVSCGSYMDALMEFEQCRSIDGGDTYLQVYFPLLGWMPIKVKGGM